MRQIGEDMFIYSVRASSIKFFGLIVLTFALLLGALVVTDDSTVFASSSITEINYSGIKDNASRVAFIESFGIDVDEEVVEESSFRMPNNFDRVIVGYNELQKKQGLDLSKYSNKKVTRYTYRVKNYDFNGEVYANIFVHRSRIIAADVSSADPDGFVLPLTLVEKSNLK